MAREKEGAKRPAPAMAWKRFPLPKGHPIKTIGIRELTGRDDIQIATMLEAKVTPSMRENDDVVTNARAMENLRAAIVEVDGRPVDQAVPFTALDGWPKKTHGVLFAFFNELNGVDPDDVKKAIAEAEWMGTSPGADDSESE